MCNVSVVMPFRRRRGDSLTLWYKFPSNSYLQQLVNVLFSLI